MSDIINIGEFKLSSPRFRQTVPYSSRGECDHKHLTFIEHGELLKCDTCGQCVTATWALRRFMDQYRQMVEDFEFQQKSLQLEKERGVTLRAAQLVETAWRGRKYVPTCPHCHKGITPADQFGASRHAKTKGDLSMEFSEVRS